MDEGWPPSPNANARSERLNQDSLDDFDSAMRNPPMADKHAGIETASHGVTAQDVAVDHSIEETPSNPHADAQDSLTEPSQPHDVDPVPSPVDIESTSHDTQPTKLDQPATQFNEQYVDHVPASESLPLPHEVLTSPSADQTSEEAHGLSQHEVATPSLEANHTSFTPVRDQSDILVVSEFEINATPQPQPAQSALQAEDQTVALHVMEQERGQDNNTHIQDHSSTSYSHNVKDSAQEGTHDFANHELSGGDSQAVATEHEFAGGDDWPAEKPASHDDDREEDTPLDYSQNTSYSAEQAGAPSHQDVETSEAALDTAEDPVDSEWRNGQDMMIQDGAAPRLSGDFSKDEIPHGSADYESATVEINTVLPSPQHDKHDHSVADDLEQNDQHGQNDDFFSRPAESHDLGDDFAEDDTTRVASARFPENEAEWPEQDLTQASDPFSVATNDDVAVSDPVQYQIAPTEDESNPSDFPAYDNVEEPATCEAIVVENEESTAVRQSAVDTEAVRALDDDYFGKSLAPQGELFDQSHGDDDFFGNGAAQYDTETLAPTGQIFEQSHGADDFFGSGAVQDDENTIAFNVGDATVEETQDTTLEPQADLFEQSRGNGDFFGDGTSKHDSNTHAASIRGATVEDTEDSRAEKDNDISDSWTKALGSPTEGLDDAWGAAFADDLDDDGFLEDVETRPTPDASANPTSLPVTAASSITRPASSAGYAPSYATPFGGPTAAPYTSASGLQRTSLERQVISEPMKFFEELPTTRPVRAAKAKPQAYGLSGPPAVAPPMGPQRSVTTLHVPTIHSQFRAPEHLDLFPPQPEARPTVPVPPSTLPQSYSTAQRAAPPAATRYSPAPSQPAMTTVAPPTASRYSPAPIQQAALTNHAVPPPGPTRNTYAASVPAAPTTAPSQALPRQPPAAATTALPTPQMLSPDLRPPGPSRVNSRYSPAPSAPTLPLVPSARPTTIAPQNYAPPGRATPAASSQFVPRTSSPLAQSQQQRPQFDRGMTMPNVRANVTSDLTQQRHRSIGAIAEGQEDGESSPTVDPAYGFEPPPITYAGPRKAEQRVPNANGGFPIKTAKRPLGLAERSTSYAPGYIPTAQAEVAPSRPKTASPTTARPFPSFTQSSVDRTSSVQLPYRDNIQPLSSTAHEAFDYVLPTDETAIDPLQRWRGYPIFRWSSGGTVVTSIPKYIPRYGGGSAAPKLKCSPGEVRLRKSKDLLSGQESLLSFPGPLKSKGKKKDVLSWLNNRITDLERAASTVPGDVTSSVGDYTRLNEQVLLWQVMRTMVEHDGILSGNPAVEAALRKVLLPEEAMASGVDGAVSTADQAEAPMHNGNPNAIPEIRQCLLRGEREKAVWLAVDNKLWGHAMLIASTADNKLWKQVAQEFVSKQVRGTATGNQSLAALYEVFAGNSDESVDQLVPLSARSGFQMVSTAAQSGQNINQLHGLDKWRETVALILGNRSNGDEQALLSLGKLLSGYNRVEAAHVCYLFARSVAHFGGAEDVNTHFTILGTDLTPATGNNGHDLDDVMLTEVYEFALSLPPTSLSYYSPHLQAYKLHHAYALAEAGMRNEAQQYCEAIASAIKATTRVSPYYHSVLTSQLDDLTKRLSQTPKNTSSGLFAKPSIGKVSGNVGKWLGKFIEGDDNENASNGVSGTDIGPFGGLTGGTPTISRTNSTTNLQSYDYQQGGMPSSRYASSAYSMDPLLDVSRSFSNPYAPSYSSTPEQAIRQSDRHVSTDTGLSMYGTSPTAPAYTKQASSMSRYKSNESPVRSTPSPPYDPQLSPIPQNTYSNIVPGSPPKPDLYKAPSRGPSRAPSRNSAYAPSPLGVTEALYAIGETHQDGTNDVTRLGYAPSQDTPSYGYMPTADEPLQGAYAPSTAGYVPQTPEPSSSAIHSSPPSNRSTMDYAPTSYDLTSNGYQPQVVNDDDVAPPEEPAVDERRDSYGFGYYSGGYAPQTSNQELPPTDEESKSVIQETTQDNYDPSAGSYDPSAGGYTPYAPPTDSYVPYVPEADDASDDDKKPKPKKKSILDDDDDLTTRPTSSTSNPTTRAQRDREVDDAVRKAADADAARDRSSADGKKGWFGGWFGGKEKEKGPAEAKVYKAKLGEESSFFFDPETKKWVNKKAATDGSTASAPAAGTPPPPRAGPPMGASRPPSLGAGTPPMSPPMDGPPMQGLGIGIGGHTASPALLPMPPQPAAGGSASLPPSAGIGGAPAMGANVPLPGSAPPSMPPSAPPSRPGTGMGAKAGVSDIDDLLGGLPAQRTAGGGKKGKRGGRYVDVMAK